MGYTIFGINGVAPTLTATTSRHYERYKVGDRYRRLTNVEYARLQGFPDDHCRAVSVYDQYALFGNAVPPPVVEWVLRQILDRTVRYSANSRSAISSSRRRDGDEEGQVLAGVRAGARKETERTR
jgi:DNA (cytosine-5)-methyltransferase 1